MKQEVTLKTIDIKINHSYKKFQLWRSPEEIMQLLYIDHCIVNVWKQSGEMFLCFHKTGFKLNLRICCFYFEKKTQKPTGSQYLGYLTLTCRVTMSPPYYTLIG